MLAGVSIAVGWAARARKGIGARKPADPKTAT
jgi:hypothetical protein